MSYSLSKAHRLKSSRAFKEVFLHKRIFQNRYIRMYLKEGSLVSQIGLVVSRRTGRAHQRNRAKRLLRELFRKYKEKFNKKIKVILIPDRNFVELDFKQAEKEFLKLFKNAGLLND